MKKTILIFILTILVSGCISIKDHKKITKDLETSINDKQGKLDNLSNQLEDNRKKINQLGNLSVTAKPSESEEKKADQYKDDGNWVPLKSPERYKNYLTGGLCIIWLKDSIGNLTEGGYLPFDRYKAEPEIVDPGDIIFKYFVNSKFNTKINVVAAVTASMNAEDYAKLKYEILGTSRLKIPQDSIESIAKKYAKGRYSNNIKRVYLATGFHIRKTSLLIYTKMAINAVATVPVANINGNFYNESESELNNWSVEVKLLDLILFIPNLELEQQKVLLKGQTPFHLLKSILGDNISDNILQDISNNPELMTNIDNLKELVGKKNIKQSDLNKLNSVGKSLLKTKFDQINNK
jgi:hypothetical protein